jgi:CMP-N-acetylneuraminic acid synthetase
VLGGQAVLAVVPARSGSKGIPGKNMRELQGLSLIGWAARTLAAAPFVDRRVLTTDSADYAAEGRRHGLDAPFLRPAHLSGDAAGALETVQHALSAVEEIDGRRYDVVLIVEPTSPLRHPSDLEAAARRLVESGADSVVSVTPLPPKFHPRKVLVDGAGGLDFLSPDGRSVVVRQSLDPLYYRDGVCYALTRACLLEQKAIFGRRTLAQVTPHRTVNIDEPWELDWAAFLLERGLFTPE